MIHHFEEINVKTELLPNGEYSAIDADNYDYDSPIGLGFSQLEAIADLFERMPRAESDREERAERQTARFDAVRKLRAEA